MNPSLTIIEAALKLAGKLPGDVIEQVAQIISAHEAVEARSRIADSIPHPHYRSLCLGFFQDWRTKAPGVSPAEVAIALRTAACSQRSREADQSVEIVWTGPRSEEVSFRHTEQAILQVLNSAQSRILLVSYAVYSIPNIQEAVVRAAKRGVKITVVVETPDKLDVQNEYSTLQALGDDVARCSTVYYWPKENRKADAIGQARHPARQVRRGRRALAVPVLGEPDEVRLQPEHGTRGADNRRGSPKPIERMFDEMIREKSLAKC